MTTLEHLIVPRLADGRDEIRTRSGEVVAVAASAGEVEAWAALPRAMLGVRTTPPGDAPAWMPRARAWLAEAVVRTERAAGGRPLAVWACAGDVVSDVPSALSFLREHPRWRLILEPRALLTQGMLPLAEDHLVRIVGTLGGHPATAGIVLGGGALAEVEERLVREVIRGGAWIARRG